MDNDKADNDNGWEEIVQKPKRRNRRVFQEDEEDPLESISYIPPPPPPPPPQLPFDSDHNGGQQQAPVQQQQQQQQQFMLLLIGIPGSGKSTLAKCLQKARPYKFVRINQDELGCRIQCQTLTRQVLDIGKSPIIDRCNFDAEQRKHFLDMILVPQTQNQSSLAVDCVIFDIPMEECIRRCQKRSNHPTIQSHQARSIVQNMADRLLLPKSSSSHRVARGDRDHNDEMCRFRTVHTIRDSHSFQDVLIKLLNQS